MNVLLKTSDEGDTKESLSKFIHQALVRRDVVISLIGNAVERGHRAYRHLDMVRVRQKAQELPVNGVPAHILKLLPCDDTLDKIQIQKAATPVPGRSEVEDAALRLAQLKPNGVVLEQSSYDEADINAQRIAAIRNFASRLNVLEPDAVDSEDEVPSSKRQKLSIGDAQIISEEHKHVKKVERLAVSTGNTMIDEFEPWYFGVAFPFIFKYCTGMPDMPA